MGHTPLTIHEHKAVVADVVSNHGQERFVVYERGVLMHRVSKVCLDEVPSVGLGSVSGIACLQHAVVHHGNIARDNIVGVAVDEVGVAVCSPAEVDCQLAVIVG